MKKWRAYIHVDGDGVSIYRGYDFDVSDEVYEEIQKAIAAGVPLRDCDFYETLHHDAEDAFDLAEATGFDCEKPDRDDYDDEEDYEADLEEYNENAENLWDEYTLVDTTIDDPGDLERFKSEFIGREFPDYAGEGVCDFDFEYDDLDIITFHVSVQFDDEGKIVDIVSVTGEGLESEDVRSSSWGDCYPDYDFLTDALEEELSGEGFDY